MKNEQLKEITTYLIEPIFEAFKNEIPPMAILLTASLSPVVMQFTDLENKTETALDIMSVAAVLGDTVAILWISESWGVSITDQKIMDRFNGDPQKIQTWVRKKWPSLEDCPYRTENLMVCVDDGELPFMAHIEMKRDDDKNLVWDKLGLDAYHDQPKSDKVSFDVTFNQLLDKSNLLKEMLSLAALVPSDLRPKPERILEMSLERLTKNIGWDADTKRIAARASAFAKSMKNNAQPEQVPPGAVKH